VEALEKGHLVELHRRHRPDVLHGVVFTGTFVVAEVLLYLVLAREGPWWLAAPLVLVLAHAFHGFLIAFHEASHGNLRPNRFVNDLNGMVLGLCALMSLALYRAVHHTHHVHLATVRDEELWPFVVPGTPRWLRGLAASLELTVGWLFTPLLFLRSFLRRGSPVRDRRVRRRVWVELALITAFAVAVVTATAWLGAWKYAVAMLLLPGLVASDLQSWRKYIEHMGLTGSTVLGLTRSVVTPGPLGRLVAYSLFNEPYHGVHHKYPRLQAATLPDAAALLTPARPDELPPFPTYRHALWHLLGTLGDPKVGAQWRQAERGVATSSWA
jgi:fatty acid desaturase